MKIFKPIYDLDHREHQNTPKQTNSQEIYNTIYAQLSPCSPTFIFTCMALFFILHIDMPLLKLRRNRHNLSYSNCFLVIILLKRRSTCASDPSSGHRYQKVITMLNYSAFKKCVYFIISSALYGLWTVPYSTSQFSLLLIIYCNHQT